VMDLAGLRLRRDHGLLLVKCSYFRLPAPDGLELPAGEIRHGLHGGAVETAMMLYLVPDSVRQKRCTDAVSLGYRLEREMQILGPEEGASFAWLARDLHASGGVGNALLADAELGARLVGHYGAAIARVIRDTGAFPMDTLRPPPA
jgi:creatinine amidohydrolase